MRTRPALLVSVLLPIGVLALAGCSAPGDDQSNAPAASQAPASSAPPSVAPAASATATPPVPTAAPSATPTPSPATTGSISGHYAYPAGGVPPFKVYAMRSDQGGDHPAYWWIHLEGGGVGSYTISDLPPGTYQVFAYTDSGVAGGYTQMVPCGLHAGCDDHTLLPVVVHAGQVTTGVDVADWYGPSSAYPPRPTYFG